MILDALTQHLEGVHPMLSCFDIEQLVQVPKSSGSILPGRYQREAIFYMAYLLLDLHQIQDLEAESMVSAREKQAIHPSW